MPIISSLFSQVAKGRLVSRMLSFFLTSNDSTSYSYSNDQGNTWESTRFSKMLNGNRSTITFSGNGWIAGAVHDFDRSTDGLTWVQGTFPYNNEGFWSEIAGGGNRFVVAENYNFGAEGEGEVMGSNRVASSTDGITWQIGFLTRIAQWGRIAFGNGVYVVTDQYFTNSVNVSTDAVNWTNANLPSAVTIEAFGFANGRFVGLTFDQAVLSTNGTTWTLHSGPTGSKHRPVGGNGVILTNFTTYTNIVTRSTDGITWTYHNLPFQASWSNIAFVNGVFAVRAPGTNTGASSTDGITWTLNTNYQTSGFVRLTQSSSKIVGVDQTRNAFDSTDGTLWRGPEVISGSQLSSQGSWQYPAYGNGRVVVFRGFPGSLSDTAITSVDGISWSTATLPVTRAFYAVAYGGGAFVAVPSTQVSGAVGDVSVRSVNGITWTTATMPVSTNWRALVYADDKFIAAATNIKDLAYSNDLGQTWTGPTYVSQLPARGRWSVAGGNSRTIALPSSNNISSITTNGTTWQNGGALPSSATWFASFANGQFIGLTAGLTGVRSTDGLAWTTFSFPAGNAFQWRHAAFGAGRYVITSGSNVGAHSTDTITWTITTTQLPSGTSGSGQIIFAGSRFVVLGQSTTQYSTSADGITWTQRTAPVAFFTSIAHGNGLYVVGTTMANHTYITSTDAITWTQRALPSNIFVSGWNITFGNGRFIAISRGGHIGFHSTDAVNWTSTNITEVGDYRSLSFDGSRFIATRESSSSFIRSTDGITWAAPTVTSGGALPGELYITSIAYQNSRLVVTAPDARRYVATSTNGSSWSLDNLPSGVGIPVGVAGGNGIFVIPMSGSACFTSTDGLAWTQRTTPLSLSTTDFESSVIFSEGFFTVASRTRGVMRSTDGITWTIMSVPAAGAYSSINAAINARFIG